MQHTSVLLHWPSHVHRPPSLFSTQTTKNATQHFFVDLFHQDSIIIAIVFGYSLGWSRRDIIRLTRHQWCIFTGDVRFEISVIIEPAITIVMSACKKKE